MNMKKLIMFLSLAFIVGCSQKTEESPKDMREKLKSQFQENVICIRVGNQCGCCNANFNGCGFLNTYAAYSISSCEFAEKLGLKIY